MKPLLTKPEINAIIYGMHGAPFSLLGMHATGAKKPGVVARVFRPYATKVELIRRADGQVLDMPRIHEDGLYELFLPNEKPFDYLLRLTWFDGTSSDLEDPYRFPLQLTDFDMHLLGRTQLPRVQPDGGASDDGGGRGGCAFRGVGAECHPRERGGLVQQLGRADSSDATARQQRDLGVVHAASEAGGFVQV